MEMQPNEIAISYKSAKKKGEQIQILAELNCCSKDKIIEVLREQGVEIDKRIFNGGSLKKAEPVAVPSMIIDYARKQIYEIDNSIVELNSQIEELKEKIKAFTEVQEELKSFVKNAV